MSEFYFTFGQQYRQERHPAGGHPDGWFTIDAPDADSARTKMFEICGPKWAMQYDKQPDRELYRRGELKRVVVI